MVWLLISLIIIVLICLVILVTKLTILINYQHFNDNDDLNIEFRIWFGLIKYKKHIPLIKIDDNSPSVVIKSVDGIGKGNDQNGGHQVNQITKKDIIKYWDRARQWLEQIVQLNVIVRKFLQKVKIKQFKWETLLGVGDAAYTGMATGALWTIKGSLTALLSKYLNLTVIPELSITPHFQAAVIRTHLRCMFQFRIGHAILAGLKLIKFWKGEKKRSKNNPNFSAEKTKSI